MVMRVAKCYRGVACGVKEGAGLRRLRYDATEERGSWVLWYGHGRRAPRFSLFIMHIF